MKLTPSDPARLREALSLSLLALSAAQQNGAIGPVWDSDRSAIAEIRDQIEAKAATHATQGRNL